MQIQQLINFQTVAQSEHMHLAAEKLNLSQSALSASIARLEEELGYRLFDRVGRSIRLNQYGKAFLPQADIAVRAMSDARQYLSDLKAQEDSQVVVMSDPYFYFEKLTRHIHSTFPQVTLKFFAPDHRKVEQALLQRRVDFCQIFTDWEFPSCNSILLHEYAPMMILSKDHPLASRSSVSVSEFSNDPFVSYPASCRRHEILIEVCRTAGFEPRITQEIHHFRDLARAVSMGKEVALDTKPVFNLCYEEYDLAMIPIIDACPTIQLKQFWPKNHREKPMAKAVRQLISDFYLVPR